MKSQDRTRRLALAALLAALALIFSYVEAIVPSPVAIPGVKLGIANLVILLALYRLDFKYAFSINIVRIVVSGLLFSGVFGILYSMAGGILSIIVMWLLKRSGLFSMVGVSMAGGVTHNIGQILVASAVIANLKMFAYLPVLMFSGIISGILIGFICHYATQALKLEIPEPQSGK